MPSLWVVAWDDQALKDLKKLDRQAQKEILRFLQERIETTEDPKRFGKPLIANKKDLWRYRVGDYRILSKIENETITVLVLAVGHRKNIYD